MIKNYRVLLYYKYVAIADHEVFAKEHLTLCKSIGLRGRILVAPEGINGTVSGTTEQAEAYIQLMRADARFADIQFKVDEADDHAFYKMFVRPKDEIVTFRLGEDLNPNEITGKYLTPEQFFEAMQVENVIIVDARNDYEYELGHFHNAIRPDVSAFRDFPEWVQENLAQHKDKKVLTYCTGGIRCEKFSGYLVREGFQDVSQLEGGIVSYGKDPNVQGRLFDGKCYVFDERIAVPINHTETAVVIGRCLHCGVVCDRYVNCEKPTCHKKHFSCERCEPLHKRSCSAACAAHPDNRYEIENERMRTLKAGV